METRIIISQIFMLAVVVLIGAISARFKVITTEIKDMLSKLIFNISLPLMLFTNFLRIEATPKLIANSLAVLGISGFVILFLFIIGWITSRLMKFSVEESAVFRAHSMFGNTIFLGFPLIHALYGAEGLLYATMFQLVSNILMWTAGVVVLTHGKGVSWKKSIRQVMNPNTIATLAGLVFFMFSLKLPEIVVSPLAELGSANTWLSMLYIGAMLVFANVGDLLKTKSLYIISFNRLILAPAILVSVFYVFGAFAGLAPDKLVSSVIILEASMPCMATVVIMAKEFGADDHLAVGNVFVSTILSILTLPLVVMAINSFL
ncbi:MAG: AEC family transporter [Bacteroidales bacterium]|jgi:predicted permease|nr:AEC family transporter [Bacteroidales bacterium]